MKFIRYGIAIIAIFWLVVVLASPQYVEKVGKTFDSNFTNHYSSNAQQKPKIVAAPRFVIVNYSELLTEYNSYPKNYDNVTKPAKSIIVLNYHGVFLNETNDSSAISYGRFKDQLFTLKSNGYETISINDTYAFLRGEKEIPDKSFLMTFDDGIKESYYNADAILRMLNYTAVLFVIVHPSLETTLNRSYHLNASELHQMQDSGRWDIQSHSYNGHHSILIDANGSKGPFISNKEWIPDESRVETFEEYSNRIDTDYKKSKEILEKEFNKSIIAFAFPYGEGEYNKNIIEGRIIFDIGKKTYPLMFYQFIEQSLNLNFRGNYIDKNQDFYAIKRLSVGTWSATRLLSEMEASHPLSLPYSEKDNNIMRWATLWGKRGNETDKLNLYGDNPNNPISGGAVYLDGSYLWTNYIFSEIVEGNYTGLSLMARFKDSQNHVECHYTNSSVSIGNLQKGNYTEIAHIYDNVKINVSDKLSISVIGNNVSCYMNDNLSLEHEVEGLDSSGGVGTVIEGIPVNKSIRISSVTSSPP